MKKKSVVKLVVFIAFLAVGFVVGWMCKGSINSKNSSRDDESASYLRLDGYKYISPLLICDNDPKNDSESLNDMENNLSNFVNQKKAEGKFNDISVYYRDINSGNQINVNADTKYFPASLTKIPFAIAFMKAVESKPELLKQLTKVKLSADYNAGQEITPTDVVTIGQSYTNEEMLAKMIKSSDNNSLYALVSVLEKSTFTGVYDDLGLKFPENVNEQVDYMTAYDFAYFLRILYNSTYLKRDLSERILELMSQSDYNDGLKAGLPQDVTIAHKFGLQTQNNVGTGTANRQMHDCGIVYDRDKPYMLCVMVKSTAEISEINSVFKEISSIVYDRVKNK